MEYHLNPPLKTEDEEWPTNWPEWVRDASENLEHIEHRFPKDILSGAPRWVDKMSLRIIQMMHPVAQIQPETSGPALLGSMLGHLMWLMESENGLSAMVNRLEEAAERFDEILQSKLTKEDYAKLMDEIDQSEAVAEFDRLSRSFIRLLARKRKILLKCMNSATNATPSEQAEFYAAYGNAMDTPPMDESGALTREKFPGTGTIYLFMVLNWKHVVTLTSGASCHAWLCTILGERLVGTKHRIEKIGYNFRINFSHRKRKERKKKRRNRK